MQNNHWMKICLEIREDFYKTCRIHVNVKTCQFFFQKKSSINNNEPEGYHNGGSTLSFGTFPGEGSEVRRSRGFPALGKALLRVKTGKRSTSAPNLGDGNMSIMPEFVFHLACSVLTNNYSPSVSGSVP